MRGRTVSDSIALEERSYLDKVLSGVVEGYAEDTSVLPFYVTTNLLTANAEIEESKRIASAKDSEPVGAFCGSHAVFTAEKRVKRDALLGRRNRKRWALGTLYILDQRRAKLASIQDLGVNSPL